MDGGVVLFGLLLLAAASQKSSSPAATPISPTQELTFQRGESEVEDSSTISSVEIQESSEVPTTNKTPTSRNIFAVTHDFLDKEGYAYSIHTEALPWLDAVRACWRRGGRLATPHSLHEAHAMGRLLRAMAPTVTGESLCGAMHVGVSDIAQGYWTTLDGKSLAAAGYDVWLGNHSAGIGRPSCAALLQDGVYVRSRCGARLPFTCEMPTTAEGYVQLPGLGQYRLHSAPLPWLDALHACKSEGAALAVPASPLEAGFLAGALLFQSQHDNVRLHGVFVGITDYANEGGWQTMAGRRSNDYYNSWNSEESYDGIEGNCAMLKPNGKYGGHPCEEPLAFCCKRTRFLRNVASDAGYRTIPGVGTYRLHMRKVTWLDAVLRCQEENATLAVPHSTEAADALTDWIKEELRGTDGDPYFHVGIHDIDGDGIFDTISERPENERNFNNWWRGYPRRNGNLCVVMGSNVFFNDPCSNLREYFCEKSHEFSLRVSTQRTAKLFNKISMY